MEKAYWEGEWRRQVDSRIGKDRDRGKIGRRLGRSEEGIEGERV